MIGPVPALLAARKVLRRAGSPVVVVDGRSGSGKTTFGALLAAGSGAALLRLEDVYPGWDGLDAAAGSLVDGCLAPRRRGAPGALRRWDWTRDAAGGSLRTPPAGPLVVEGCGALSRRSSPLADLRLWVALPTDLRRRRALERDGEAYAPHWERWARQERRFIAREDPVRLADLVVDGRSFP